MVFEFIASVTWGLLAMGTLGFLVGIVSWISLSCRMAGRMDTDDALMVGALWSLPLGFGAALALIPALEWGMRQVGPAHGYLVPFGVFCASLLLLAAFFTALALNKIKLRKRIRSIRGRSGERQVSKVLARSGLRFSDEVFVALGDDVAQVDHLVEVGDTILILETKNWPGEIFGKPDEDRWTQKHGDGETTSVRNPTGQVRRQMRLMSSVGIGKVRGLVVFASGTRLASDRMHGAIEIGQLPAYLARMLESCPRTDATSRDWDALMSRLAEQGQDDLKARHARMFDPDVVEPDWLSEVDESVSPACEECGDEENVGFRTGKRGRSDYLWCDPCNHGTPIRARREEPIIIEPEVMGITSEKRSFPAPPRLLEPRPASGFSQRPSSTVPPA